MNKLYLLAMLFLLGCSPDHRQAVGMLLSPTPNAELAQAALYAQQAMTEARSVIAKHYPKFDAKEQRLLRNAAAHASAIEAQLVNAVQQGMDEQRLVRAGVLERWLHQSLAVYMQMMELLHKRMGMFSEDEWSVIIHADFQMRVLYERTRQAKTADQYATAARVVTRMIPYLLSASAYAL